MILAPESGASLLAFSLLFGDLAPGVGASSTTLPASMSRRARCAYTGWVPDEDGNTWLSAAAGSIRSV